jgi:hypothetical protein
MCRHMLYSSLYMYHTMDIASMEMYFVTTILPPPYLSILKLTLYHINEILDKLIPVLQ